MWNIPGFQRDFKEKFKNGETIRSPKFDIVLGDLVTTWSLSVYPAGNAIEAESHTSLFVVLDDFNSKDFSLKLKFGILRQEKTDNFMSADVQCLGEIFQDSVGRGLSKFVHHDKLLEEVEEFFSDTNITIFCEMFITTSLKETSNNQTLLNEALVSDFQKSFQKENFVDFALKTKDGKSIKVHKVIIATRSPVFFKMLTSDMEEIKQGWANIPDFDSKLVQEALRFIYCNKVENLDEFADDLIFFAEKYQIEGLKEICIDSFITKLSNKNVLKTIIIADRISKAQKLFYKCIDVIDKNYHEISMTQEWKGLDQDLFNKINHTLICKIKKSICI